MRMRRLSVSLVGVTVLLVLMVPRGWATPPSNTPELRRVSLSADGGDSHEELTDIFHMGYRPAVAADAAVIAFASAASDLVPGDINGQRDIFVKDLKTGAIEIVSVSHTGGRANGESTTPAISADGRFVAFMSLASNLVLKDMNGEWDIFVFDRQTRTTELMSVNSLEKQTSNGWSRLPSISADGRYVAFDSAAANLDDRDTGANYDVFVRDRELGTTEIVSLSDGDTATTASSYTPSISADGRFVTFDSDGSTLVAGDTNGYRDIFIRDRVDGTTRVASVSTDGVFGNDISFSASVSGDGRSIAFISKASNLVPRDQNIGGDIFVRDLQTGRTERVSADAFGREVAGGVPDTTNPYYGITLSRIWGPPSISSDGRYVAFTHHAPDLVAGDTNNVADVFVKDRLTGSTELASATIAGAGVSAMSSYPALSPDGRYVAFVSDSDDLVPDDESQTRDVFLRDRGRLLALGDIEVAVSEGKLRVNTSALFPKGSATMTDPTGDVPAGGELGADLTGGAVAFRGDSNDLMIRWEASNMPTLRNNSGIGTAFEVRGGLVPSYGGVPGLAYSYSFSSGGIGYMVVAQRGASTGDPSAADSVTLSRCTPTCAVVADLAGAVGAAGTSATAAVPLSYLGTGISLSEGALSVGPGATGGVQAIDAVSTPALAEYAVGISYSIVQGSNTIVPFTSAGTFGPEISFELPDLTPGTYELLVQACSSGCVMRSQSLTVT